MSATRAEATAEKRLVGVHAGGEPHWVGDGFPVRSLFSFGAQGGAAISPFLLLDYGGPVEIAPSGSVAAARQMGLPPSRRNAPGGRPATRAKARVK